MGVRMSSKIFLVLLILVILITIAGGVLGNEDLTPDTPPDTGAQVQGQSVTGGVSTSLCASPYRVKAGDTLSSIATRCGVVLNDLLAANPTITNPNLIRPGQDLRLPAPRVQLTPTAQ